MHIYGQPEHCLAVEEAGGEDKNTQQLRQGGHST